MATTDHPHASRQHASKTRLLDAALGVIRTKGYAATTVDDICDAAGLTKGSFFHHFASKEELALAAAAHFAANADALFAQAPYRAHPDARDRLLGYVDFRRALLAGSLPEFTCLLGTMVQETYATHPALRAACETHIGAHADTVAQDAAEARDARTPDAAWSAESSRTVHAGRAAGRLYSRQGPGRSRGRRGVPVASAALPRTAVRSTRAKGVNAMSDHAGKFVWYDVMTTDAKAGEAFYRDVIGWKATDLGMSDRSYTIFSAGEVPVGGLMPIPEEARAAGAKPHWTGYIAVDDVDAYAKRVTAAGGAVHRAPEDIPGVGRFAVVADPHGAGFILFKGAGEPPPNAPAPGTPGHAGWHELQAGDRRAPSPSIQGCSAGPRRMRWIWARWASIRSSPPAARRSAA